MSRAASPPITTTSPSAASPLTRPVMSSQPAQTRRPRPGLVQTNIPPNPLLMTVPPSAVSTSSVASSFHGSPVLSPETAGVTTGSSIVPSPEPQRGRDLEQFPTPDFQLPGPILLSHKSSTNSLQQPLLAGQAYPTSEFPKQSQGLIRRLSNRAAKGAMALARPGRRPSSAHPTSRDTSVGPGFLRRRSDSTNTAPLPDLYSRAVESDSDCDAADDKDDVFSLLTFDGACADVSPTSAPASIAGSTTPSTSQAGPVIPLALLKGTWIRKVSKKNNQKYIPLVLEPDAAKITWDRTRPSKCVYIDDIKEIRTAEDIRQYRLDFGVPESEEPRFFTIMYAVPDKSHPKMMHLIADDDEAFVDWTTTLDAIFKHRQDSMASLMAFNDKAVRAYWEREMAKQLADKPHAAAAEDIDFPGVERVCRNLHIHVSQETLKAKFNAADATRSGRLDFTQFQEFVRLMTERKDVRALYREIASDIEKGVTRDEFLRFLREIQCENVGDEPAAWDAIFAKFARRARAREAPEDEAPRMSEAALASYLTSTFNLSIAREPQSYTLDRPMNEYFISSSHNTYLLGRQIKGTSSVEGYISALIRGCRCVEIDCWDGPDGQPIVVHGKTWTTRISFREVINTVNKYAFVKSRFPLWISLEVHCNPEQQRTMAAIMKEVFGAKLVTEPLPDVTDRLPTPSEMMDRILIKAKKTQAVRPDEQVNGEAPGRKRGNSLPPPYPKPLSPDSTFIPPQYLPHSPLLSPNSSLRKASGKSRVDTITEGEVHETPSSSTSDCDSGSEKGPVKQKQSKIVPELGHLAVYCVGLKFRGFDNPDCKMYNHVLSFVESTFEKNTKSRESKRALFRHNMRHLMRVYPNQTRINSNNFNPLTVWRKGVQMAALNWQTYDLGMQLNQAMFDAGTDQSGYVLKPKEFREFQVMPILPNVSAPDAWEGKRERKNIKFSIDVISAQQLMRPVNFAEKRTLDPFVEVEVFLPDGHKDKEEGGGSLKAGRFPPSSLSYRTSIVRENGFNPLFEQRCNFDITTKFPDLVFVRWSVRLAENGKYTGNTMATFTAKLSSLKQGYRTIPLLDSNADQYLFSTLLCRIKVGPPTSIYVNYVDAGADNGNKFQRMGRVFNRASNMSPKSSVDGGAS